MISIEQYARKYHKYHPVLVKFSSEFLPYWVLQKAIPKILKIKSIPSGRRKKIDNQTIRTTPAFVLINHIYWADGVLNKEGIHSGNNFDLSDPEGMALFLHEAYHVYQWYTHPVRMLLAYIASPFVSFLWSGKLYDHRYIAFEREAIEFQWKIYKIIKKKEYKQKLEEFKKYR
jgi:hypothetical protein